MAVKFNVTKAGILSLLAFIGGAVGTLTQHGLLGTTVGIVAGLVVAGAVEVVQQDVQDTTTKSA